MKTRDALILAGSIIVCSLVLTAAQYFELIGRETQQRWVGVAIGLALAITANFTPKMMEPMCARCDPARAQALQHFAGWTLVIAGLGHSAAMLTAPFDIAPFIAMAIVATGVTLVVGRLGWVVLTSHKAHSG